MSDEEDATASEAFSASEDEWEPSCSESSNDDQSDFIELPTNGAIKKSGQSLRSQLYSRKRPRRKTFDSLSQQKSSSKKGNTSNDAQDDSSSESSVEDYLVNPANLDLRSSFFTATKDKSPAPQFDCNAGISNLSDSGSEDNKENATTKMFDFHGLLENANSLERCRKVLEDRRAAGTHAQEGQTATMDVNALLALGENQNQTKEQVVARRQPKSKRVKQKTKAIPEGLDSEESEFEEVADDSDSSKTPNVSGDLEIHIGEPSRHVSKKQKTQVELEMALKRRLNRDIKDRQLLMHKASLMCLIARSLQYNRLLNDPGLIPQALKMLPTKNAYPTERGTDLKYLQSFGTWFKTAIKLLSPNLYPPQRANTKKNIVEELLVQIKRKEARCKQDMIFIFIVLARGMGMNCRLIVNLQPMQLRPAAADLIPIKAKTDHKNKSQEEQDDLEEITPPKKPKIIAKDQPSTSKAAASGNLKNKPSSSQTQLKKEPTEIATPIARRTRQSAAKPLNDNVYPSKKIGSPIIPKLVIPKHSDTDNVSTGKRGQRKRAAAEAAPKRQLRSRHAKESIPQLDGADDIPKKRQKLQKRDKSISPIFEPVVKPVKKAPVLPKSVQSLRRVSSSTDDESINDKTSPTASDMWLEVWSEVEEQWICINLFQGKLHSVDTIRRNASPNLAYVFAFQNDLSLKDVTQRYCPSWTTMVRKARVEKSWLDETIAPYLGQRTKRDISEDEQMRRIHLDKPLPKSIYEFKDHPFYALERHLLKFQALYPPDPPTLGFIRGEPVYSRDCVHLLHSREVWLKDARVVKLGEQPYKIVNRPKWDKLTRTILKEQPLEVFGYWQTQEYEPPTAENGLVPRNEYGNVELFKDCMLPKKTVHLRLPGLMRVCKKLNIDCANAVVGFDFHQGGVHAMYDGFVVCEEFKEAVKAAWEADQLEQARKEREKYEARVYGNWKKLIKLLLIRERLKKKYNF